MRRIRTRESDGLRLPPEEVSHERVPDRLYATDQRVPTLDPRYSEGDVYL